MRVFVCSKGVYFLSGESGLEIRPLQLFYGSLAIRQSRDSRH